MNSSDYDKKMGRAKKSADDFGASLAKGIGSAAGKVAGALGLAMGAAEGFERAIRGSQTTSDEYDRVMRSVKTSVDTFFTAISTGDFTAFHQGLDGIIAKARNAQSAIDQLGNTTMSYNYFNTKNQAEFAEAITTLRDKEATADQRAAAIATANQIMGSQEEITEQLKKRSENAVKNLVTEGNTLNLNKIGRLDIDKVLRLDVSAMGDEEKAALSRRYKEYVDYYNKVAAKHSKTINAGQSMTGGVMYRTEIDYAAIDAEMSGVTEKYQDAILYNEMLVRKSDEWLQNIINIYTQSDNAGRNLANMERQLNRASQATPGGTGGGGTPKANPLKTLQMSIEVDNGINYNTELGRKVMKVMQTGEPLPIITQPIEIEEVVDEDPLPQFNNDKVDNIRNINEEIAVMSNLMTMANSATAAGADGWLQWMTNVIQATSTAIAAIRGVVIAKQAEGAASAGASAAASGPFGWLMIAPAIAAAIAAFAAIPKFAEGGIVGGSSFFGDKLLARVNSGECILTQSQQARALSLMEGGNVRVTGDVRLSGKDIFISLRNYMKATGNRL